MIPFITDAEVGRLLDYAGVQQSITAAFESLARGGATIQARQRIDCGSVKLSSMGAIWLDAAVAGTKVYTTVDGQFSFLFNLFDVADNRALAVMQANELTRYRTPALSALVAQRTAVAPKKLALFGAGVQGRSHFEALVRALPLERVSVVDVADVSRWCAAVSDEHGISIQPATAAQALEGADVVVTATRCKQPLFDGRRLKPGAVVVAVGTSLPNGRELDDATLARAARVIVEWMPQSSVEAGEVVLGRASRALREEQLADLPALFAGRVPWRTSADEIVVFKSVGVGLTDLAAASLVWDRRAAAMGEQA